MFWKDDYWLNLILENEKFNPKSKIAMTQEVLTMILGTGSVVSNLKAGEEITQKDLLYYVLMSSAGDCTYLAAIYYSGSVEAFVEEMNKKAKELNFDYYTTTLSISPYKNSKWINEIGFRFGEQYNVKFMYSDFKKNDGYKKSIVLSKEYNLYR